MDSDLSDPVQVPYDDSDKSASVQDAHEADPASQIPLSPSVHALQQDLQAHVELESLSVGLSDPKLSERRRRQLDVVNKLHNLGVQRDIDIPEIVVIGSQSAGKSSLIESISGITLPRANGTCTRCPTECRLIHSTEQWRCNVTLRFLTDTSGNPLPNVRNVVFGPVIRSATDVEERLRQAQLAVLNPSTNYQYFLGGNMDRYPPSNEVDFTTNCVSIEIKGSNVTDLSFVDLPGLIASVSDGGRDEDVEKVKQLVSSYIAKPSCIILLTVACETDFETQGAYSLAKQHDKNGTRTIGVLTKPDRIPEGEEARWLSLIKNERAALKNGWFCVKQPSSRELEEGVTFLEARRRGDKFFGSNTWAALDEVHRRRLGSQSVARKLNEFLMDEISKRFPELMSELTVMLKGTKAELQEIPEHNSKDPVMELIHLVGNFTDDVYRHAEGLIHDFSKRSNDRLMDTNNLNHFVSISKAHEKFQEMIKATGPRFRPFNRSELFGVSPRTPLPVIEAAFSAPQSAAPSPLLAPEVCLPVVPKETYVDEVVERVRNARTRELSGCYPFSVIQTLIRLSTDQWKVPALDIVEEIHSTVFKQRRETVMQYFGQYTEGGLRQLVSNIMREHMEQCRDRCIERIKWLLELEANPFTVNNDDLCERRDKILESLKEEVPRYHRHELLHSGPWAQDQVALEIMATVTAYIQIASKRVVDMVPLAIDREIVRVQKSAIQEALTVGLRITAPEAREYCQMLLAEPAEVVARRSELESRLVRLQAAQVELESV